MSAHNVLWLVSFFFVFFFPCPFKDLHSYTIDIVLKQSAGSRRTNKRLLAFHAYVWLYSLSAYTQIHAVRHLQPNSDIVRKYVARSESWRLLQSPHVMPASNRTTYLLSVAAKKQKSCMLAPSSVNLHADESVWDIWGSKNAAVSQNSKASLGIKILFIGDEGRKILHPISLMFLIPLHMLRHYGCGSSSARLIFPEHILVPDPGWFFFFFSSHFCTNILFESRVNWFYLSRWAQGTQFLVLIQDTGLRFRRAFTTNMFLNERFRPTCWIDCFSERQQT